MAVIGEAERLEDVIHCTEMKLFAGMVTDVEALNLALERGLVEYTYEGPAGFLGLAKLRVLQ